jgi:hypothetical protein
MGKYMMNKSIDRNVILKKLYEKHRAAAVKDTVINELDFLKYPQHNTAIYTLSKVQDPDYVVIYTYGGHNPHIFHTINDGVVSELAEMQFTWEWMHHWLDNNVAIAIFDMPDYFRHNMFVPSFYRLTPDRMRESKQVVELIASKFPNSKLAWHGLSFGAIEAAKISLEDTRISKVILSSATWHTLHDHDAYHQGVRLNWYNVADATVPVLIVQHQTEKFEYVTEQMTKTDSITVKNDVPQDDGHFFRGRQMQVVNAMCNWLRNTTIQREIE